MNDIKKQLKKWKDIYKGSSGPEKAYAFDSIQMLEKGYFSPDEIMELSSKNNLVVDSHLVCVKRTAELGRNVTICNSCIDGENVIIGDNSRISNARIYGNGICFGKNNKISGVIQPSGLSVGKNNELMDIFGKNSGRICIGNNNSIHKVTLTNPHTSITIGNNNRLNPGLQLNSLFTKGKILIGNGNDLGRDGGGVISTAYWFSKGYWGHTIIGNNVETTRGCEILGFSLIGIPFEPDDETIGFFLSGPSRKLEKYFESVFNYAFPVKLSMLKSDVLLKDLCIIRNSYLKNISMSEQSRVFFSESRNDDLLYFMHPGIVMEKRKINKIEKTYPTKQETSGYLNNACRKFYSP